MTLNTSQLRKHAALLRERDDSPAAAAQAALIEAEAELADAHANRPAAVADSARMVEEYPILGKITREAGQIISIEHPWTDEMSALAREMEVDVSWEWCHDPMAGLRQGELVRIYIGTKAAGPRLQWDRHTRGWRINCNARNYGNNWASGGQWSCLDKTVYPTLSSALDTMRTDEADQIREAIEPAASEHTLRVNAGIGSISAECSCGWDHSERTNCRPSAWGKLESAWLRHNEAGQAQWDKQVTE